METYFGVVTIVFTPVLNYVHTYHFGHNKDALQAGKDGDMRPNTKIVTCKHVTDQYQRAESTRSLYDTSGTSSCSP